MHELEWKTKLERALSKRIFLIHSMPLGKNEFRFEVRCSGRTIYNVHIGKLLQCTCPEFRRQFHFCNHLILVLSRILKCDSNTIHKYLGVGCEEYIQACKSFFDVKPISQCSICFENHNSQHPECIEMIK